jgi:hypothetical protein
MERVQFVTYKGKRILIQDCSNLNPGAEFTKMIKKARNMIAAEPEGSVLSIFDATGCSFNTDSLNEMKEFTSNNTPFIKKATVVGMNGLLQVALSTIAKFTGRDFSTFKTREEAMEYLANL